MQMSVPSMIAPRAIQSVRPKKIHSGLFTDASPVFRFVTDTQSQGFEKDLKITNTGLDIQKLIRFNFLNNYLGYNMLIT